MNTKVKICGIRTYEHAQAAIELGADFLGFVFVPNTKHFINPNGAKEIINQLLINNYELKIKLVGVFQNQSIDEVNTIAEKLELDFVQLHGEEDYKYMSQISKKIIKKINLSKTYDEESRIMNQESRERKILASYFLHPASGQVKYFLIDRPIQGQGEMVDLSKAKEISETFPTFFAGGLTPENVSSVVAHVRPFAVDVCSGVMTHHIGDAEKIKRFIQNAKSVFIKDSGQARMTFRKKGLSL